MTPAAALIATDAATRAGDPTIVLRGPKSGPAKAREQAQDFEAVFLNSMFQHMFAGIKGDGPFGGGVGVGVWRSFLIDEHAKSFAKSGGIGLADHVYSSLIAQQEANAR